MCAPWVHWRTQTTVVQLHPLPVYGRLPYHGENFYQGCGGHYDGHDDRGANQSSEGSVAFRCPECYASGALAAAHRHHINRDNAGVESEDELLATLRSAGAIRDIAYTACVSPGPGETDQLAMALEIKRPHLLLAINNSALATIVRESLVRGRPLELPPGADGDQRARKILRGVIAEGEPRADVLNHSDLGILSRRLQGAAVTTEKSVTVETEGTAPAAADRPTHPGVSLVRMRVSHVAMASSPILARRFQGAPQRTQLLT